MKIIKITSICLASSLLLGGSTFAEGLGNKTVNVNPVLISAQKIDNNKIVKTPIVGAPSKVTWTFQANKKGTYKIKFSYSRPWEKKIAPIKTVEYTLEVSEANKNNSIVELKTGVVNKVRKGQKFNISLEENASTGYSWSYSLDSKAITAIKCSR